MKQISTSILTIATLLILSGCGGAPKSAGNNKWLDFGNGMVNLSNVANISCEEMAVKFDDFTLTLAKVECPEDQREAYTKLCEKFKAATDEKLKEELREKIIETEGKINEAAKNRAHEKAQADIERIRNFIDSSDTYLRL